MKMLPLTGIFFGKMTQKGKNLTQGSWAYKSCLVQKSGALKKMVSLVNCIVHHIKKTTDNVAQAKKTKIHLSTNSNL